jgi:hypothetical protein
VLLSLHAVIVVVPVIVDWSAPSSQSWQPAMLVGKNVVVVVVVFGIATIFALFDILSFLLIKLRLEENRFYAALLMR